MTAKLTAIGIGLLLCGAAFMIAAEPEWNPAAIKECDRTAAKLRPEPGV
jgi:hypothetical protein